MISATYFGEITELGSRAVWYSDEENDDDEEDDDGQEVGIQRNSSSLIGVEPLSHENIRANISLNFQKISFNQQLKFTTCIISLASSAQYKHFKLNNSPLLGYFDSYGRAYAYPIKRKGQQGETDGQTVVSEEYLLWLLFDSSNQYINGHEVGYFVEKLRENLQSEFQFNHSSQIIILSSQYSTSEHLEYLGNINNRLTLKQLPFIGRQMLPPSLIKNQFESALFEQLTLSLSMAFIACLPNPKNFWFDKTVSWPSVPGQIIEHKLNDDSLEKTLIFT